MGLFVHLGTILCSMATLLANGPDSRGGDYGANRAPHLLMGWQGMAGENRGLPAVLAPGCGPLESDPLSAGFAGYEDSGAPVSRNKNVRMHLQQCVADSHGWVMQVCLVG